MLTAEGVSAKGEVVTERQTFVPDSRSLTATTAGFDTQLRRFETTTAWDRIA